MGRVFSCGDCEELFEMGGVPDLLAAMSPLFEALNITMVYSDDEYADAVHTIALNGQTYVMAAGSMLGWGETFLKFAEMVNHALRLCAVREQIYLLSSDDSQYMIFLTKNRPALLVNIYIRNTGP